MFGSRVRANLKIQKSDLRDYYKLYKKSKDK